VLRSIRGRLTIGSTLIAAVVLVALAVVLGEQLRHVAGTAVTAMAEDDLQSYIADLRNQPGEEPDQPQAGMHILAVSPQSQVVIDTLPPGMTALVEHAGLGSSRLRAGGVSYVATGRTVTTGRGTWRLWAVRPTSSEDLALRTFGGVVLLAIPVILLLVALGSWVLVRVALRPVDRLRIAAEHIRNSGRPGRLPEGGGRDELAELTTTLNGFLAVQQEAVERERRMVADASHELRTPLAVLTAQLEVARRHAGDAAALEAAVVSAQADVAGLTRLATQLLELSAADAIPSSTETATTGALVLELMKAVDRARALADADVQVDFRLSSTLEEDALVPISAVGFARIVDNLATNAVKATRRGTVELLLEQAADRLVLTVADTGHGFPADFLPRAFDRFARSEQSRADGTSGSGIGLTLVRALVRSAGGEVTLANRREGGAEAVVRLPIVDEEPPAIV